MSVVPPLKPQVAKPPMLPEVPIAPSVKTLVPPAPSCVKLPEAVLGAIPAIKLGVSGVQSGVNGLLPLSFEVVIETTTGETILALVVPSTVMAPKPVQPFSAFGAFITNSTALTFAATTPPDASLIITWLAFPPLPPAGL